MDGEPRAGVGLASSPWRWKWNHQYAPESGRAELAAMPEAPSIRASRQEISGLLAQLI